MGKRQSRRFLECVEESFLTQLVSKRARGGALLGLLFANREELVGDVVVRGCLGHSDHDIHEKNHEFSMFSETKILKLH